jgi:hypothetical protein
MTTGIRLPPDAGSPDFGLPEDSAITQHTGGPGRRRGFLSLHTPGWARSFLG